MHSQITTVCSISGCVTRARSRGWCKIHYTHWLRYGDPLFYKGTANHPPRDPAKTYFWPRVDHSGGLDACWPWTGPCDKEGYGQFAKYRPELKTTRIMYAHRYAYDLAHPDDPLGDRWCLHSCDNPPCCNERHLRPGTLADNMADMKARGRFSHGEESPASKLTGVQVVEIRARSEAGESFNRLSKVFGVSRSTITHVVRRLTWRSL